MQTTGARAETLRLSDFEGDWSIRRRIDDRMAGQIGHLEGTTRFVTTKSGLDYFEVGTLRLPGQSPMQAERRYSWREAEDRFEVYFDDGRLFHAFDPARLRPSAGHWCDPDSYAVRYDFSAWPIWTTEWHVTGPRKDYVMHTDYTRDIHP